MSKWISVSDKKPEGICLVRTKSEEHCHTDNFHMAHYRPNVSIIGNHFDFDMPEVIEWIPLKELMEIIDHE